MRSLKTQADIRRALAWVWRQVEADNMEPPKAKTLIYCALSLSGVMTEHDLEARMEAMEADRGSRP